MTQTAIKNPVHRTLQVVAAVCFAAAALLVTLGIMGVLR